MASTALSIESRASPQGEIPMVLRKYPEPWWKLPNLVAPTGERTDTRTAAVPYAAGIDYADILFVVQDEQRWFERELIAGATEVFDYHQVNIYVVAVHEQMIPFLGALTGPQAAAARAVMVMPPRVPRAWRSNLKSALEELSQSKPVVLIDRHFSDCRLPFVGYSNRAAVPEAFSAAKQSQVGKLWLWGAEERPETVSERLAGYGAVRGSGFALSRSPIPALEFSVDTRQRIVDHIATLVVQDLQADLAGLAHEELTIFAVNESVAAKGVDAVTRLMDWPEPWTLIAFDGCEKLDARCIPGVNIHVPARELGNAAAEQVVAWLASRFPNRRDVHLAVRPVARN